jgi:hypothetical protein
MTTHYIATIDGCTFKRSTAGRTYTHMVVVESNIVLQRKEVAERAAKEFADNLDWFNQQARGWWFYDGNRTQAPEKILFSAEEIADGKAKIAAGVEGFVANKLANFDAAIAKHSRKSSDGKSTYGDAGWCGRADLAQKLAAKYTTGQFAHITDRVHILPAVKVEKAPKVKVAHKAHHALVNS